MITYELLVPLQGDASDIELIGQALILARPLCAQVTSVYAQLDPIEMLAWPSDGLASASLIQAAQDGNNEAWDRQNALVLELAKANPHLTIERLIGHPEVQIAKRGTLSDVAVFSCESARGKTGVSAIFTALLMDAYAPVLILRGGPAPKFKHIAIAWDGGLEVSRAAKAALMFLKAADTVSIIQSQADLSESDQHLSDPHRLKDWLARHDIVAASHTIPDTQDIATDIVEACSAMDVDLLVCGAYGHSRAREFIFGGVTRTLIKTTTSPSLFLSH